jgi:hypothetical protein
MRQGQGILLITNALEPAAQAEFESWYLREHLPDRLGIPGFLRGRRYRSTSGAPRFMALYETRTPEVLQSPAYLERLANPTPRTERVMPSFRDMCRSVLRVAATQGSLEGGQLMLIDFPDVADRADILQAVRALLPGMVEAPGICAVHLWLMPDFTPAPSPEAKLRGAPDRSIPAALAIEATDAQSLEAIAENVAQQLPPATFAGRQMYQFLCALSAG